MKLKPIPMSMVMHMSCEDNHFMTYRNEQYGITDYRQNKYSPKGKNDRYLVIDGDKTEYRDMEQFKAALVAKFPDLEAES